MKKKHLPLLLFLILAFQFEVNATIRYVRNTVWGTGNGNSWTNASDDLQLMIDQSNAGDEVWVATSYNRPKRLHYNTAIVSPNNRDNSFVIQANVKIYGGFSGNETSLAQRNWQANVTYLDGDIGIYGDSTDNCYSVIRSIGAIGTALLDGFYIENGTGNGANANQYSGGGMYIYESNPTVTNCIFTNNMAIEGGAMYIHMATPAIVACSFSGNNALGHGGAIYAYNIGTYTIDRCLFTNNRAARGGAIANQYSQPAQVLLVKNSMFSGNYASGTGYSGGGAVYNRSEINAEYINCTFAGNRSASYGGAIFSYDISSNNGDNLKNCIVWGNTAVLSGQNILDTFGAIATITYSIVEGGFSGIGNSSENPGFITPRPASWAPTMSGDYKLLSCSPAVNSGNNTYLAAGNIYDLSGNARIQNTTVDKGAYEITAPTITPDANGIVYVKGSNPISGSGGGWGSAAKELSDVLKAAANNPSIQQVWVAAGTYYPLYDATTGCSGTDNRNRSFVIPDGVKLYGGFAGTETAIQQRNWNVNITTLSGDLGNYNDTTDNAYHVVSILNNGIIKSVIDGFTIRDGNSAVNNGAALKVVNSDVDIRHCTIMQNRGSAGILEFNTVQGSMDDCTIKENETSGGATILLAFVSNFNCSNSTFKGNRAYSGILICGAATGTFRNCIFSGNRSTYSGSPTSIGLIACGGTSQLTFTNCTNSGNQIAAGALYYLDANCTVNVSNSINYGNIMAVELMTVPGAVFNINHSVIYGTSPGNGNLNNVNPEFAFAPSASTAPFTSGDYRLQRCSPAINKGNNSYLNISDTTDISGSKRIGESVADMGAYEYIGAKPNANGIVYVDSSKAANGEGNSWNNAVKDLGDALRAAKYDTTIHQIWVAKGTYKPMFTADSMLCNSYKNVKKSFVITNGLQVYGGFAGNETQLSQRNVLTNSTRLSGELGTSATFNDNSLHVVVAANITDSNTLIDGFMIEQGYATGGSASSMSVNGSTVYDGTGSGIVNIGGVGSDVINCIITNNAGGIGSQGGGLYIGGCSPLINNSKVMNNSCTYYGGICNYGSASPTITNCTISGNQAAYGGGIGNVYGSSPSLTNCIISGNYANSNISGGGGILNFSGSNPVITNCTITGNKSNNRGGGIFDDGISNSVIRNSILWLNDAAATTILTKDNIDTANNSHTQVNNCIVEGGYTSGTNVFYEHPVFVMGINATQAPTTAGNFSLSLCSPAINRGNNSFLPAGTAFDIAGNQRTQQNNVDLGALENLGFIMNQTGGTTISSTNLNAVCGTPGYNYANQNFWHNIKDANTDKLIISINDFNNVFFGNSSAYPLSFSAYLRPDYGMGNGLHLQNPFGQTGHFYLINRWWSVTANAGITAPVNVRFYFTDTDSSDIASQFNFGSLQNLVVYKVNGTNPFLSSATGYKQYTYAPVPDTNHFSIGTYQGIKYVQFQVTSFSSGSIAFISPTPLATRLGDFSGVNAGNRNRLEWNTYNEQEGDYFEVERSDDGKIFSKIGEQAAQGSAEAQYTFWDENPLSGNNYYRLKMISRDGASDLSKVIRLFVNKDGALAVDLYPNPVKDIVQVQIKGHRSENAFLMVIDVTGKVCLHRPVNAAIENLNMEAFAPGIYQIKYTDTRHTVNLKCVKE